VSKQPFIVITGPTASGKSDLAIEICKQFNGYVINADSRQIYKDLKIGTAQPTPQKIKKDGTWFIEDVAHYLYGFVNVDTSYNIAKYQNDVKKILAKEKERLPVLVGGTGLYIDSVVYNYSLQSEHADPELRKALGKLSVNQLQEKLDTGILDAMNDSDRNNPRRLIRAIEKIKLGEQTQKGDVNPHIYLVVDPGKEALEERIIERTDLMFEAGLLEENQALWDVGVDFTLPSMNSIGYAEFVGYFKGEKSLEEVREEIIIHTRQYAKRQRTWFRRREDAVWVEDSVDTVKACEKYIKNL
jgi:tRNA dimethylallyltransferase